jgi:DNA-binding NarL/FixJ family response regulator
MGDTCNPVRIVIGDEQPIFRHGVRRLLEAEPGFLVIGEASDAPGVVGLARQHKPNILLLDVCLALRSELQALNGLGSCASPVRVVVMVRAIERREIIESFRLGAFGIVLKTASPRVLLKSLRSVMAGRYWLESESVAILVEAVREFLPQQSNGTKSPKDYGLTPRELEIITRITSGRSNKEISQEFSISERTVKHHLTSIFDKVGVSSRLELALFALNHHLLENGTVSLVQPSLEANSGVL